MTKRRNPMNNRLKKRNNKGVFSLHPRINPAQYAWPRTRISKVRLSVIGPQVNSTSGGNILYNFPIDPTTGVEWSTWSSLFEEYRVLGGLVTICTYVPTQTSGSSVTNSLAYIAFDPVLNYTPVSASDAISYSNRDEFQVVSLDRMPFRYGFKYPTAGPNTSILWEPTGSPVINGCIIITADHVTPSNTYFDFIVDFYIEFRSKD